MGRTEVKREIMFADRKSSLFCWENSYDDGGSYIQILILVLNKSYTEEVAIIQNSDNLPALTLKKANGIFSKLDFRYVLRGDQVQFFDHDLIKFVNTLDNRGRRIMLLELDVD